MLVFLTLTEWKVHGQKSAKFSVLFENVMSLLQEPLQTIHILPLSSVPVA